jgi:phosphatidylglycerophosphate synthase
MIDARLRRSIDPLLDRLGRPLAARGIGANEVTLLGFAAGLGAVPAIAAGAYGLALALILTGRILDGLDGAVARASSPTDFGGFLDIVCDFIVYAAVPFGFALSDPENALAATFLAFSFMGTGSSFLAYAVLAAKRGVTTEIRGRKSFYYLGGLTEGFETILCFMLMCLVPSAFVPIAWIFGALCWITTLTRILAARDAFGSD